VISIPQPAMALNSAAFDVRDHYRMDYNEVVSLSADMVTVASAVEASLTAAGGSLRALVINAHGLAGPDGIALGTGFHLGNIADFCTPAIRGHIDKIYCCSCEVANTGPGYEFCRSLAMQSGAIVIASKDPQVVGFSDREWSTAQVPEDHIDDFEGTTYAFHPDGGRTTYR
jgi:hypothetical protein